MSTPPEIKIGAMAKVVDETSPWAGRVAFVIQERVSETDHGWGVVLPGHPLDVDLPLWFGHDQLTPASGTWSFGPEGATFTFDQKGG
jgi:hypothetical protein